MKQVTIENPVINSPFSEPRRRFKFNERGITDEIVERRQSEYFIPNRIMSFLNKSTTPP